MEGFEFPVEVVRTNRTKSISIRLVGSLVQIRAPQSLTDAHVRALIAKRTAWIKRKRKEISERPVPTPKQYVSGETFPYLGQTYQLTVETGTRRSITLNGERLMATVRATDTAPHQTVQALLERWYRAQAERDLNERTERLAKIVGVAPRSITVKSYKARWGSCSIHGDISYNWRIIMTPHRTVDYVVIHELCHMLEHNHSPQFWQHVEKHVPDWKECRDWLNRHADSV